jgi:hypothetical protein
MTGGHTASYSVGTRIFSKEVKLPGREAENLLYLVQRLRIRAAVTPLSQEVLGVVLK